MYKCVEGHQFQQPAERAIAYDGGKDSWTCCPKCGSTQFHLVSMSLEEVQ